MAIVTLSLFVSVAFFAKANLPFLLSSVKGAHVRPQNFIFSTKNKIVFGAVSSLLIVLLFVLFFACAKAFATPDSSLVPDTNKITATVEDDGTIRFGDCNLLNNSNGSYEVQTSSVSVSEESKSVKALNDFSFTINGFDGVLFDGAPDGSSFTPENLKLLPNNESTRLSFNLQDLDKDSIFALCGKNVFEISLIVKKVYQVTYDNGYFSGAVITGDVPVDDSLYEEDDLCTVKDKGSLVCGGYTFSGWEDKVSGTTYQPSASFSVKSNIVLSAV